MVSNPILTGLFLWAVDNVEAIGVFMSCDEDADDVMVLLQHLHQATVKLWDVPGEMGHPSHHARGDVTRQQHLQHTKHNTPC